MLNKVLDGGSEGEHRKPETRNPKPETLIDSGTNLVPPNIHEVEVALAAAAAESPLCS